MQAFGLMVAKRAGVARAPDARRARTLRHRRRVVLATERVGRGGWEASAAAGLGAVG